MLNNLGTYFQKFQNIIPRERLLRTACDSALQEVLGITLGNKAYKIQRGIMWIQAQGVVRQEIERNKEKILTSYHRHRNNTFLLNRLST
jgi:hypothetical protein